jgi:hypothetical protein
VYHVLDNKKEDERLQAESRRFAVQQLSKVNEEADIAIIGNQEETIQAQLLQRKTELEETIEEAIT